ncbi:leader peptidase (prepilin peptidase)/N-methyltransferase [Anaerosolibacter carboniphilus]|uniref:Prepilin leader peptidase/N-methyltransferase n=1 Tax=Anaerosolibacter carboniphilus TaxID=1417629 RepID=A0A841L2M7_9FIRM|nr:A24 family peptidase [Anaerosolibacter carboniphilus]MBB6216605.1 leader peptidase (prepilin peptidase)/N-methyltransferase [Anaerosolibacter carboniphilus]
MLIIVGLFGLIIGSFLNVCIWRIPRGESIAFPSSHCPQCNTFLKPVDLIPVASFILFRGKCRYCGEKISLQYPMIEALNGLIYVLLYTRFGYSLDFIQYAALSSLLLTISLIDIQHQIIPDHLTFIGLMLALGFGMSTFIEVEGTLGAHLLGLLIGGGFLLLVAFVTNGAMGGGDIKLMGMLGLWLGWKWTLLTMLLSFVIGACVSLLLLVAKIKTRKDAIPFGPFIAIAALMTVLYGNDIINYYVTNFL